MSKTKAKSEFIRWNKNYNQAISAYDHCRRQELKEGLIAAHSQRLEFKKAVAFAYRKRNEALRRLEA